MTSLVAFGIAQIQRPSWWNEPSEPWKSNIAAKRRCEVQQHEFIHQVVSLGRPVSIAEIAEFMGHSVWTINNRMRVPVRDGYLRKVIKNERLHLEATDKGIELAAGRKS